MFRYYVKEIYCRILTSSRLFAELLDSVAKVHLFIEPEVVSLYVQTDHFQMMYRYV